MTRLWLMDINVTFEAENAEVAATIAQQLTQMALEHPQAWAAVGDFEPEQTTETVD